MSHESKYIFPTHEKPHGFSRSSKGKFVQMPNANINTLRWCIFLLIISAGLFSCQKSDEALDVSPRDRLSDASLWADAGAADLFLNGIYGSLPDQNNSFDPFDNWSDNSVCGFAWPASRNQVREASYTPSTIEFSNTYFGDPDGQGYDWALNYSNIRKCNLFIKNVENSETLPANFKAQRIPEARFLRAYFYHMLWMAYGGVPIITEALNRSEQGDEIFKERNTSDETYNFIVTELNDISSQLPEVLASGDLGRASRGAALVLKGWCELYNHKYPEAAATNKMIIDDLGGSVYELHPDYGSMFLDNNNREGIFFRQYIARVKGGRFGGLNGPSFTNTGASIGWGGTNPTQELVDDYAMDDGLPITVSPLYDPQKPYERREKRFYQSIVYDGSYWYDGILNTRVGSVNEIDLSDVNDVSQTGYYIRKRIDDSYQVSADSYEGANAGQNYYYFRYAEVLLNYAEAQNEAVGPDQSVYDAINLIRTRGEIPDLTPGLNQAQMRDAIRRERRVELAFEDKRYWDLLRWNIAHINLNQHLHGMKIEEGPGGVLTYTSVPVAGGDKSFNNPKNYLFPIPQSAIDQNSKLEQNPGY